MDTAGAVVGPLVGLAGYQLLHQQIRPLLVIAVAPAVASVLLVAALRDTARTRAPTRPLSWRLNELPGRYWRVVAVLGVFNLVNFPDALLLLRLHEIGFSVPAIILAYVAYNAVYTLLSYPAGVMADRLCPAAVFGAGLVAFAAAYTGLGLTRNHLAAWLLVTGYGGFTALTDGVGKAWISGLLPSAAQGSGQGLFQACPASASSPPACGPVLPGATTAPPRCWFPAWPPRSSPPACSPAPSFLTGAPDSAAAKINVVAG